MPRETLHQNSFTAGEISDDVKAREDFDQYYKAVDKATNVLVRPTGGLKRRPGFEYVDTVPADPDFFRENGANYFQLIDFVAREDEKYLGILTRGPVSVKLILYRDGKTKTSLDGSDAAVALPYSSEEIRDVDWVQKLDKLFLLHEDYKPRVVTRTAQDTFTVDKLSFTHIPQYDFDDSNSPSEQNEKQELNFNSMSGGDPYDLSLAGETTIEQSWNSTNSTNASRIEAELRKLPNTSNDGIKVSVKDDANDKFTVEFAGDDGNFDWPKLIATAFSGSGTVSVSVTQEGSEGKENVWSSSRGWPKHGVFFQDRLWLGGSKSLPETIWGSKTSDYFNFDLADAEENDAIQATINNEHLSEINWLHAGRNLLVGTQDVEYYVPETPITPSNIRFDTTTQRGTKPNVKPVQSAGSVYYLQSGDNSLREYVFSFGEDSYKSTNISILSSHLIKDPIAMSLTQSEDVDGSDVVYIVNKEDGNMAAMSLLKNQDVTGFTEIKTKGRVRETRALEDTNYFITERNVPEHSESGFAWEKGNKPKALREAMAGAQVNDEIHLLGGIEGITSDKKTVATHNVYKLDEGWNKSFSLPFKREYGSATSMNEKIYFGGGQDSGNNNKKDFLVSKNGTWKSLSDLPISTTDHELVAVNEKIYLLDPNATHVYDPKNNEWSSLTSMSTKQFDFTTAVYEDDIYLFGGQDSNGNVLNNVKKYDTKKDSFTSLTNMNTARKFPVAEYIDRPNEDVIWVVGGQDGNDKNIKKTESYDINNDSWTTRQSITREPVSIVSGKKNEKMYVVGQGINKSNDDELISSYELDLIEKKDVMSSSSTKPDGIAWGEDGDKFFECDPDNDEVNVYKASQSYSLDDTTQDHTVSTPHSNPRDIHFNKDGTSVYFAFQHADKRGFIEKGTMETPYDLQNADYNSLKLNSPKISKDGVTWENGGKDLYVTGNSYIEHYEASTSYDLSSLSFNSSKGFSGNNKSGNGGITRTYDIVWANNGSTAFVLIARTSSPNNYITQYSAGTDYDVNSLSFSKEKSIDSTFDFDNDNSPRSIAINDYTHSISDGPFLGDLVVVGDKATAGYYLPSTDPFDLGGAFKGGNSPFAPSQSIYLADNGFRAYTVDETEREIVKWKINEDEYFQNNDPPDKMNSISFSGFGTNGGIKLKGIHGTKNKMTMLFKKSEGPINGEMDDGNLDTLKSTAAPITEWDKYTISTISINKNESKVYAHLRDNSLDNYLYHAEMDNEGFLFPNTVLEKGKIGDLFNKNPYGIEWSDGGEKIYINNNGKNIQEYENADTPYSIKNLSKNADFFANFNNGQYHAITWNKNGTKMFATRKDGGTTEIISYEQETPDGLNRQFSFGRVPVTHLEKLNNNHLLDTSKRVENPVDLQSKYVSGFEHLANKEVDVYADGSYRGKKRIKKSGQLELDEVADDYVEVGLDQVTPRILFIKPTLQQNQTTITDRKKRIVEAQLQLQNTKGLTLNGNKISFRKLGENLLDQAPSSFTGKKDIDGLTGWSDEPQLEITQPSPQPFTLLGLIQVVSF